MKTRSSGKALLSKITIVILLIIGIAMINTQVNLFAQEGEGTDTIQEEMNETATDTGAAALTEEPEPPVEPPLEEEAEEERPKGHQLLKKYFIDGDPVFMMFPLICLILGLAFAIERIITLNLASTNTNKLLKDVEGAVQQGDIEKAKEITKSTRGPIASIFNQGLHRVNEGIDIVEKSIISYGSVQMGLLERGLVWLSLFISLAPMLGFMGTVIGMIRAFDDIEAAGDISPSLVAGGIKMALITTVFGLIVAIILQVFYNYIISKIDDIVNNMEDSSIAFVDILVRHDAVPKK